VEGARDRAIVPAENTAARQERDAPATPQIKLQAELVRDAMR
jgi:hypothetical protein